MRSLLFGMVLMSILLLLPISVQNVSAGEIQKPLAGPPDIQIILDQDLVQANVEPGNDGIVRFTGTVYCDLPPATPPGQYCVVQLSADAGGWPCSNPEAMVFDRNHNEEQFDVSVQVPIETSGSMEGQFSVSARWNYSPGALGGNVPATTAMIEVLEYSSPKVLLDVENNSVPVGKWGELEINILNGGNDNDDIQLEIINLPDGTSAYFPGDKVLVPEKLTKTVKLKFKQSSGRPKTHQLTIIARGSYNGTKADDQQTLIIETTISARSLVTTPFFVIPVLLILAVGAIFTFAMVRKKRKKVRVKELE